MPRNLALIALAGAALLAGRSSTASSSGASSSGATPRAPRAPTDYHRSARAYAAAKRSMMLGRWNDTRVRAALQVYAPRYLPGLPLAAALCFGVSSQGPSENTGGTLGERGLFNVETRFISAWANDAETLRVLGRAYDPSVSAYAIDLEAQVYTGMRRYRVALDAAAAALGQKLEPATPVDAWAAWCAVDAYSAGAGTLAALANGANLSGDRNGRPAALASFVDAAAVSGASSVAGVPLAAIAGAAWAVVRPLQRYIAGRELAAVVEPSAASWFALADIPLATDERLSTLAHGG